MSPTPVPPPPLKIPPGNISITVSAIDSTMWLSGIPTKQFYAPPIPGFGRVRCGCWSLLIEHPSGRKLLYDLGLRKNWKEKLPPTLGIGEMFASGILEEIRVERDVSEMLQEGREGVSVDVAGGGIEAVVWSHFHFDHTGDMGTFPGRTKLVVGEGFKEAFMPGWPVDPKAQTVESDFEGREVLELDFGDHAGEGSGVLRIGDFKAIDYFRDGSFYILDSPGHAIGHVNALARTNVSPPEFVHLCGDTAHHCGEIRPSKYLPLPESISPSPSPRIHHSTPCPGGIFTSILRNGSSTDHILELIDPYAEDFTNEEDRKFRLIYDQPELERSVRKVEGFDANENVFTILAHDWSLKGLIREWPGCLNGWKKEGWRERGRWGFLGDFRGVVGEGEGEGEK